MMMKVALVLLAGTAILPAAASANPGNPAGLYELGKCIARADRDMAGQLLQELPLSGETEVSGAKLGPASGCLKEQSITVSSTLLRGGIAQALLLKDFPRFGVEPKIAPRMFVKFDLPSDKNPAGADERTAALYKLADCVVRNQAIKTEGLFRSAPGSAIEGKVLDALGPYINACQGKNPIRVSRADFRSMMAQAAYNVSVRYWSGELWSAR